MGRHLLRIIVIVFLLIPGPVCESTADSGMLAIHFIDVGNGDSTLIAPPDGSTILLDTGSPVNGPILVSYLKLTGLKRIDSIIFTHAHDDHFGGIFSVSSSFDVDMFYDNGFSNFKSSLFHDYVKLVRSDLSRYRILQAGENIKSGEVEIEVLNPLMPPSGDLNEDSIVLKVNFRNISILLAGDIGLLGQKRLLNAGVNLKSNILKIGYHDDVPSASDEFLDAASPEAVIISEGAVNKLAVQDTDLIKRLQDRHIRIFRTDRNGSIFFRTDGRSYKIKPEKHPH